MRRLLRWLFNGLTALSLLLCVATFVLWNRSDRPQGWDQVLDIGGFNHPYEIGGIQDKAVIGRWMNPAFRAPLTPYVVGSSQFGIIRHGRFECVYFRFAAPFDLFVVLPLCRFLLWGRRALRKFLASDPIGERHRNVTTLATGWAVWGLISLWSDFDYLDEQMTVLILAFISAPLLYSLFKNRSTTQNPGICSSCGYDLRGTPNRCPECGLVVSTKAQLQK